MKTEIQKTQPQLPGLADILGSVIAICGKFLRKTMFGKKISREDILKSVSKFTPFIMYGMREVIDKQLQPRFDQGYVIASHIIFVGGYKIALQVEEIEINTGEVRILNKVIFSIYDSPELLSDKFSGAFKDFKIIPDDITKVINPDFKTL